MAVFHFGFKYFVAMNNLAFYFSDFFVHLNVSRFGMFTSKSEKFEFQKEGFDMFGQ